MEDIPTTKSTLCIHMVPMLLFGIFSPKYIQNKNILIYIINMQLFKELKYTSMYTL